MPYEWQTTPSFGKKRPPAEATEGLSDGLVSQPKPHSAVPGSELASAAGLSTPDAIPAGRAAIDPRDVPEAFEISPSHTGLFRVDGVAGRSGVLSDLAPSDAPHPEFGKSVCCVTYAVDNLPDSTFAPLTGGALDDRLTGRVFGSPKTGGLLLPMPSGAVVVSQVPAPMKASALADDMAQRAVWPDWRAAAAAWRSHVVVSAYGEAKSLPLARACAEDVTTVAALLADKSNASGVYWAGSGLILPTPTFVRAVQRTPLPVEMLFRCVSRAGPGLASARTGVTTRGLHLFALPEIDQPPTGENLLTLSERLMAVASHLLMSATVPKNGDTVWVDERGSVRIRHAWDVDGRLVLVIQRPQD